MKKLTLEDIQMRNKQYICFGCNEKWFRGHKCKVKHIFLVVGLLELYEEDDDNLEQELGSPSADAAESPTKLLAISLQEMGGFPDSNTIGFKGSITGHMVSVLVDFGSTHNFICPNLAKTLGLPVEDIPNFDVLVANGEKIQGSGICGNVELKC